MAAYLKDVENNTRDMTADRIIKEKMNKTDKKDVRIKVCYLYYLNVYCKLSFRERISITRQRPINR